MKRKERHHLKEDQMLTGLNKFYNLARKYQKEILIALGVCVFVAAAYGALLAIKSRSLKVQSRVAGQIFKLSEELAEKPENVAELEKLAGKGKFARLAYLELARHSVENTDYDKAGSYLENIPSSPKDIHYYQSENLKARIFVGRGDYDAAIAVYQAIEEEGPADYPLDAVLFSLAEVFELKGQLSEARELFERIQQDYGQTYYGYEASIKAGRLLTDK